ncbi:HAMP domain-containing sensor histidine kinase [Pseudoalteromonas umbrosa]|uniref:HAMP domain-containing sensor histidine kinase n=1 Tax=Pseudoalteromonas umbrosa TaxID=3048489 RepID=UPI0024C461ED|nr:HAMP domain-containing sensor histidine kinase [Pseudoalteromonas sp. B95]MDK1289840.1 HAMP domain-containing sensor histidine kinase [Pseudoalteromonas sp. B95]
MNSYIGRLATAYVCLCAVTLVMLFPIYKEIESQQNVHIKNILVPDCPYCELRQKYIKDGPFALKQYLNQDSKWISFKFLALDEITRFSTSVWLQQEVIKAAELISSDKLYVTFNINPSAGKKLTLVYLELDNYVVIEEKLLKPANKATEVAEKVSDYLSLSLLITALIISTFLLSTLYISRKIYQKINKINLISESISKTGDLSKRIPVNDDNNEFNRLAKQLNQTFATIEAKVCDISNMSNTLAHELKTPLTQLTHQIEALDIPYDEYVILKNSAEKATDVFNSILRISRLETGNARLIKELSDINEIITDSVDLLSPIAELKKQNLQINTKPIQAHVDKSLIFQAVLNLLDNAIKYSPDESDIKLSADINEHTLIISIQNACKPIDQKEINNLTSRFIRGSNTNNSDGLGLGLTLVNAIAAAHQGELKLKTTGERFTVTLLIALKKI